MKMLRGRSRGASLVEYGMLAGLIAVVAIASISTLGRKVDGTFQNAAEALEPAPAGEVIRWTMTAGQSPYNGVGYEAPRYNDYGSVTVTQGDVEFGYIRYYSHSADTHDSMITMLGDQSRLSETHKLVCNHGEWDLASASLSGSYHSFSDSTMILWNTSSPDKPEWELGKTYDCAFVPK